MSFLKRVAGAFVEMEHSEKPSKKTVVQPIIVNPAIHEVTPHVINETITNEFTTQFRKILEDENKRNYPGNDYYEFKAMKDAMSAVPQEDVRYKAAFAGWAVGDNQTKKSLVETANIYLGLVQKEIDSFQVAYKEQYHQQVTANETLIEQKTRELQAISEKAQRLNQEVAALKQENQNNTDILRTKHDAFLKAGEAQKAEILAEIQKINQYIN